MIILQNSSVSTTKQDLTTLPTLHPSAIVTKDGLQQLRWLGHQGHHRPVPVRRAAGDQLRHHSREGSHLYDGLARPACVFAQQARHRRQPHLVERRSSRSASAPTQGQGPVRPAPGEPPTVSPYGPEANATFASLIVGSGGLWIGDTRSLRPSAIKNPRASREGRPDRSGGI